ncbi:hypothetical protein GXP67_17070 [Rhodocytophaga rosea]|uniref:Uncharacterized protein n=1 Tax=Rhodocytophaga rosea TaxID=2704465 RepID=A0A6C0GJI2_9BACT|nr:hypothetical protein [Rhodocytophaga rosea]QHT68231.1 hypothetical protein GXP67_17070 [Rhodocytophaga rosea]
MRIYLSPLLQEPPYTTFGSALAMYGLYRVADVIAGPAREGKSLCGGRQY